jgi:hypothetical protein
MEEMEQPERHVPPRGSIQKGNCVFRTILIQITGIRLDVWITYTESIFECLLEIVRQFYQVLCLLSHIRLTDSILIDVPEVEISVVKSVGCKAPYNFRAIYWRSVAAI